MAQANSQEERRMLKADVICPKCNTGLQRIELSSLRGTKGEYRCPICEQVLEVFDGSKKVAYRVTVPAGQGTTTAHRG